MAPKTSLFPPNRQKIRRAEEARKNQIKTMGDLELTADMQSQFVGQMTQEQKDIIGGDNPEKSEFRKIFTYLDDPIAQYGFDPDRIRFEEPSKNVSPFGVMRNDYPKNKANAYYASGDVYTDKGIESDVIKYGVKLGSSKEIIAHEARHRGFQLLRNMQLEGSKEDQEAWVKKYGKDAAKLLDLYFSKKSNREFAGEAINELRDRPDKTFNPPKFDAEGNPAGMGVFSGGNTNASIENVSLEDLRESEKTGTIEASRFENRDGKHLLYFDNSTIKKAFIGLDQAAKDAMKKQKDDYRKKMTVRSQEGERKFNHGGDVPHADESYLNNRAENIIKEFNKPNDEFLDTAIDLATEPLQEAKQAFMQAGKGAVFEMLPKNDPRIYQAFRQTNDYLAGLGYAGFKTGEAAAKFVAGALADALGQDKGEIGYQILRDEKTAARDIMGGGEAFAGMVGTRSIQMLDDAIDAFGGYFKLLKTAEPVIKADLGGKLQALADGDFDFLKESSTPKTISAQVTGQGTTPVDQPSPNAITKPKSLVSPLFKTVSSEKLTGYSSWGDSNPFYSSVEAAIENLPVGKEGIKGSNVIKYLTKKAPNINMRELYWSGMLEDAPMRGVEDYRIPNTDQRGIDPNKIYTKEELKYIADVSMPQVMVKKFSSLSTNYLNQPQWRGMQQVSMDIFTLEPVMVATSQNTPTPPSILNRPAMPTSTNRQQTFRIGRGNFEGGQSPNSEYVEYLITNVNSRGSTYPKSDAHWRRKVDNKNETVLAHVRGSFIPIIYPTSTRITKGMIGKGEIKRGHTTTNVFVVDEIQADPAQKSPAEVRADKPSAVASQRTSKETAKISNAPEVDVKTAFTTNLTKAIDEIGRPPEFIPTSDRFNRIFGVDENDAFSVQTDKVNQGLKEIAETLADVEKKFLANDIDADEVANIIRATFNDKLKTTAILRNTRGPGAFPEAVINQIKLNVLGDLIYGKGTVKRNPVLKTKLQEVITNSLGGKPIAPTDITPVGTGDSIRLGLLSIMREAVKKNTNTIVIPPLDDLMKAHSLGEKPTKETYEDAMMKALRILRSETNKKVSFTKGKIKGLQFDSDKNYLIINFDSDIVDETKQTRFAEGGLV